MITINGWDETFENSESRKLKRLNYVNCPSGVDSSGYLELMVEHGEKGILAFAVFQALAQLSATFTKDRRGTFQKSSGEPMSVNHIASLIRMPESIVETALQLLESPDVNWISRQSPTNLPQISQSFPTDLPTISENPPDKEKGKERETKEKGKEYIVEPEGSPVAAAPTPTAFDQFWSAYPRKVGKGEAKKAFAKAKGKPPIAEMIEAVQRQSESKQWIESGGQFIPNPATWLNQGRWDDETEKSPTEKYTDGQW